MVYPHRQARGDTPSGRSGPAACRRHQREITLDTASLLWGLLFGTAGFGFFVYGKKQQKVVPLVCGLVLMVFPYFVSNTVLLVAIGALLIAIPYFVRI